MPSVRIEDDAFLDGRYDRLAQECGLADADHARGKMARLWRQCTAEKRYHLDPEDVIVVLGPRGPDGLVAARLGDRTPSGIRIRGTKGRIEWLEKLRKNGKKGGRPRKAAREPDGYPSGSGESNPPALVTAPALVPVQEEEREGNPAAPAPLSLVPPEPAGPDTAAVLWARQNEHRTGAGLRALKLTAVARKAIAARLKDYTPDELAAVVDEDAASARRTGDWQWFNGETNWRASNVARTYGRIGTQRAGPIGTANHRPSPPPTLPRIAVENAT